MKNSKYWQSRAINLEKLMQDRTDQTVIQVNKLYDNALHEMDFQIQKIFGSYLNNSGLQPSVALQLLNERQTKEMREKLLSLLSTTSNMDIKREIIAKLDAPAYASRISRIEALKDQIYFEARMIGVRELNLVSKRLIDTVEQAYYRQTFDIQKGMDFSYNFENLSDNRIKAMLAHDWTKGGNYSKRIWGNNEDFALKARDIIEKGILTGQSAVTMRDSLIATVGMDNDSGARYVSNRLIRTEVSYFSSQGQKLSYEQANIKKYRFIATLDLSTSAVCRKLDLKTFDVKSAESGVNLPPMHPHCRSTTSPYIASRDYSKLQRRARDPVTGKNILVPANMSYEQWYDKYVRGNECALIKEKQLKNAETDEEQFKKYKLLLGKDTPSTLEKFKEIKYNNDEEWRLLKVDYRRRNELKNHPEKALPNLNSLTIDDRKFTGYLFNAKNEIGYAKGQAFSSRLGYNIDNYTLLKQQILKRADKYPVTEKGTDKYGTRYQQKVILKGVNGKSANAVVAWIVNDGSTKMTSAYLKEL